jgi:hypothetical protein
MCGNTGAPIFDSSARLLLPTETSRAKPRKTTENNLEQGMRLDEYLPPALDYFLREEAGASFIEYALVASLITVVCAIAALAWSKGI